MQFVRYETAKKFLEQCLEFVTDGGTGQYIENVTVLFTHEVEAGKYDSTPEEEYQMLLNEVKELGKLWNGEPRRTAGELLLSALEKTEVPPRQLKTLARVLAKCFAAPEEDKKSDAGDGSVANGALMSDAAPKFVDVPGLGAVRVVDASPVLDAAFRGQSAKEIRDAIAQRVLGQKEAVRTAAMITYNRLTDRRTNAVFAGPSGCGKSEIWRTLSKEYPGLIRMVDFSRFTAEGWKGSLHLRDIFSGIDPDDIRRQGLIVVLDEADKIVCEHAVAAGGTDHNALTQNCLLKMLDGDVIEFGAEDGKPAFSVDCSKVSVVLLGAFERLLVNKSADAKHIGFGAAPKSEAGRHKDISYDDLISAGMRREIAGRINRIVALDPLSVNDYKSILLGPVKSGIEYDIGWCTYIDDAAATTLAEKAAATGLGVRWMKSALQNAIDDAMFDTPEAMIYGVVLQDGEICCQAWMPREVPERVVHELHIEADIELVADSYAPISSHSSAAN